MNECAMHLGSNYVFDLSRELSKSPNPVIVGTSEYEIVHEDFEFLLTIEVYEFVSELFRVLEDVRTETLTHCQPYIVWTDLKRKMIGVGH